MFAIAISFLIYSGATFDLMGYLIVSQLEAALGTDFYMTSELDKDAIEGGITKNTESWLEIFRPLTISQ